MAETGTSEATAETGTATFKNDETGTSEATAETGTATLKKVETITIEEDTTNKAEESTVDATAETGTSEATAETGTSKMKKADDVFGFDLGTTRSGVAVMGPGMTKPEMLKNKAGARLIPSVVQFRENGLYFVGDPALKKIETYPKSTVYGVKRLIGKRIGEKNVNKDIEKFPFPVIDFNNLPYYKFKFEGVPPFKHSPQFLSALIIQELKKTAEIRLKKELKKVVITVPARFNQYQRIATIDAARIVGLEADLLSEPTSAALAAGLHVSIPSGSKVLVFDLGGGTFDVSILKLRQNGFSAMTTDGDDHLGCEDFDDRLLAHFVNKHQEENGIEFKNTSLAKLRLQIKEAREILTEETETTIDVNTDDGPVKWPLTRSEFEELCEDLFKRMENPVEAVLASKHFQPDDIHTVVRMGGGSRMPWIKEFLQKKFPNSKIVETDNADEGVALGAAVYASLGTPFSEGINFVDITSHSLGIECTGYHPETGVWTKGLMKKIILKDLHLPANGQASDLNAQSPGVRIAVYEGEHKFVKENTLLGSFYLPNNTGRKAEMYCNFAVGLGGILTVTAGISEDPSSIKSITIEGKGEAMKDEEMKKAQGMLKTLNDLQPKIKALADVKEKLKSAVLKKRKAIADEPASDEKAQKRLKLEEAIGLIESAKVGEKEKLEQKMEEINRL